MEAIGLTRFEVGLTVMIRISRDGDGDDGEFDRRVARMQAINKS